MPLNDFGPFVKAPRVWLKWHVSSAPSPQRAAEMKRLFRELSGTHSLSLKVSWRPWKDTDLAELLSLTIRIDNCLRARRRVGRVASSLTSASVPFPSPPTASLPQACSKPEPMQLGRTSLSPEERQRRVYTVARLASWSLLVPCVQ